MKKLKIVKVNVGEMPEVCEIKHSIEEMHKIVGGYLEAVRISDDIFMWVNESGVIDGLPLNFITFVHKGYLHPVHDIHGNAFFTGMDEFGETQSLTDRQVKRILDMFKHNRNACIVRQENWTWER
jgi:hypothetical protein